MGSGPFALSLISRCHCAAGLRRAELWGLPSWPKGSSRPGHSASGTGGLKLEARAADWNNEPPREAAPQELSHKLRV